jgi:hypothetical protein
MLTILVFVLISMWAVGFFGGYVMGGLIHILLAVALIAVVFHFVVRRTA